MSEVTDFNIVVKDQSGQPVSGARVVVLTDRLSGRIRMTDPSGFVNFWHGPGFNPPITFDLIVDAGGYAPWGTDANSGTQVTLGSESVQLLVTLKPGFRRPVAKPHSPLPAFDPSDQYGEVHTTPPPELVIPPGRDQMFIRADFNGVEIPGDFSPFTPAQIIQNGGVHLITGPYSGLFIPYLQGSNTTPPTMIMTSMLPMYPKSVQDVVMKEHCERGYTHFIVASDGWNMLENGFSWSPDDFTKWCRYVRSWGMYVVYWGPAVTGDQYLVAGVNSGVIDWHVVGEEVDSKMSAEQYESVLDWALTVGPDIPRGAHFTANYPEGFPRDTFLTNWDKYNGKVHLMWQANQNDSAGKQGAMLYYARMRVNIGGVGGNGALAPDSRVYAYETMATAQLYGQATEEYGCLRSLELLYTSRADDRIRPVSGFGNGCRLPNGDPI